MKNILVIGGSSGIGLALVKQLAQKGHHVMATYNNTKPTEIQSVNWQHLNVEKEADYGFIPDQLHGLVYCPGRIELKPFHRFNEDDFLADYRLQVLGAIKALQAARKALIKSQSASVVLFSTVAVQNGFSFHTQVSSSKGAIEGLTRALAAEWAPKIRVNAIAPSLTDTPLANFLLTSKEKMEFHQNRHPLKRVGQAEDLASMAAFLLSEEATWMSGQVLAVDGGMSRLKNS